MAKTKAKTKITYPDYICDLCGTRYGRWWQLDATHPAHHCATYHIGDCQLCQTKDVPVTEPRDYGYLIDDWEKYAS